uniref:Uncharacterized protein n=1 Tax=Neogoniolithon spectabile TaxID=231755 RepID=A0A3G3MH61_9FLOR|nr:hypothetical protein [Neogoniolithon spectabile]AYR06164.1 hypothetical protein [Neogoniolithon spectabile]
MPNIYLLVLFVILFPLAFLVTWQILNMVYIEYIYLSLQKKYIADSLSSIEYLNFIKVLVIKKLWFDAIRFLELRPYMNKECLSRCLNTLGFIYESITEYGLAEQYYFEAVNSKSCYLVAMQNLAKIYDLKKKNHLAIAIYKYILRCDPKNVIAKRRISSL